MSDEEKTDPGFVITPAMSKKSQDKAKQEAFENAQKVVDEINAEAEKPSALDTEGS